MGASPQTSIQEFKNDIYKSRCVKALICVIFCHLAAYCSAVIPLAVTNTSISNIPSHWWSLLYPSSWVYLAVLVGLTSATGFVHAAWYSVKPVASSNYLNHMLKLMNTNVLGNIISHVIISTFMMRSYLGLFRSPQIANLFENCHGSKDFKCINEWHLFLVCQAAFNSIFCSISYFLDNRNMVTFPVIQQKLLERVGTALLDNLKTTFTENLHTMKWFYIFYFFVGGWLCHFLTSNLDATREGIPVDSILGILNIPLFINALTLGTLSRFVFQTGLSVFEIIHTDALPMEVTSMVEAKSPLVLTAALEATDSPLLQLLAFLELSEVARGGPERRVAAFRLSQPGGHPHTWNQLATSSLAQITGLTQRLEDALSPASNNNNKPSAHQAALRPDFSGMRDLASGGGSRAPAAAPRPLAWQTLAARLRGWAERRPVLGALLAEPADARASAALASGRPAAFAAAGLSGLAVASYSEDKFGVAQHHLPDLLRALLDLSAVLERARRPGRGAAAAPISRLAAALRQTVTTALFRLTATFGSHLGALGLSDDTLTKLEPYRLYAEG